MKKNIAEIIEISREIYDKGLVSGKSGNISARFKNETKDIIAITPTLKSLSELNEKDIVLVDLDGNVLTKGKPSSEVNICTPFEAVASDAATTNLSFSS